MKAQKILTIQYLRGLAALGVVFCHYGSSLASYPKLSAFFNFGQTGVHVCFLISGFIIVYSLEKSDYKPSQFFRFLLKRSIRIDPSYIAVIILTILLYRFMAMVPSFKGERMPFIPAQFLAHIFYVVPFTKYPFYNHVFWTLSIEFQFYLIIGILYFLSEANLYKYLFLSVFSLTCLIPFSNSYYLVFNYAPIFALGIALVTFYQNRTLVNLIFPIAALTLIAYKFGPGIACLLISGGVVIVFFKSYIKPLIFFGDISYSLYLIHGLVLIVLLGVGKRLGVDFNRYELVALFAEIAVAVSCAYAFFILVEKPSLKLSKYFFYSKTKSRD